MDTDLHRLKEGSARLQSFPYLICVQSVLIRGDESYQISAVRGDEAIKLEKIKNRLFPIATVRTLVV